VRAATGHPWAGGYASRADGHGGADPGGHGADLGGADRGGPAPRRRWGGAALALLLMVLGAAGALWLAAGEAPTAEVVALARPLSRGQLVTRDDLAVVRVAADGGAVRLATPEAAGRALVGRPVLIDLPAGTLLGPEMVGSSALPAGHVSLGVRVAADGLPSPSLRPGDLVDVVGVETEAGQAAGRAGSQAVVLVRRVQVADVRPAAEGAPGGDTVVYLIVPEPAAEAVATAALADRGVRLLGSAQEAR
jgi:Flp pilus assembly protein CpaB